MGQEIDTTRFKTRHFNEFTRRLQQETTLLSEWAQSGRLASRGLVAGCELEAWLVDRDLQPA
ncbi:MAG: glutamate--cysteine ligase, partial [Nitrococcus sp.]|nr:glutamate--cysteine ligase [Nitrococcus sp.]